MALIARTNLSAPVAEAGAVLVWRASQPPGHPDLVLARAVCEGVIDQTAAQLIGDTRLEDQTLATAAARQGLGYREGRRRRRQAEQRLIGYLGHGNLVGLHRSCRTQADRA